MNFFTSENFRKVFLRFCTSLVSKGGEFPYRLPLNARVNRPSEIPNIFLKSSRAWILRRISGWTAGLNLTNALIRAVCKPNDPRRNVVIFFIIFLLLFYYWYILGQSSCARRVFRIFLCQAASLGNLNRHSFSWNLIW